MWVFISEILSRFLLPRLWCKYVASVSSTRVLECGISSVAALEFKFQADKNLMLM